VSRGKLSKVRRSENMRCIKSKDTKPEILVRQAVHSMGYRFRLHVRHLPGKPDLVFPRLRKIVEVRGCFWHQHSRCIDSHIPKSRVGYWRPKLLNNRARDNANLRRLRALGYAVLVLWECEILERTDNTLSRLRQFLES